MSVASKADMACTFAPVPVGAVERVYVAGNARLDLGHPPLPLVLDEIAVAIVDGL